MMLAISSTIAQMFVTKSSQNIYTATTAVSNTLILGISSNMFYSAASTVLSNLTANYFILVYSNIWNWVLPKNITFTAQFARRLFSTGNFIFFICNVIYKLPMIVKQIQTNQEQVIRIQKKSNHATKKRAQQK